MEHLRDIDQSDLWYWQGLYNRNNQNHPLDLLYGMGKLLEQSVSLR